MSIPTVTIVPPPTLPPHAYSPITPSSPKSEFPIAENVMPEEG